MQVSLNPLHFAARKDFGESAKPADSSEAATAEGGGKKLHKRLIPNKWE